MVVSMIGIVKAGAAYLPLDTDHPSARLLFMLKDSGAALLVTTTEICSRPLHSRPLSRVSCWTMNGNNA